jgi:hypothetical protein
LIGAMKKCKHAPFLSTIFQCLDGPRVLVHLLPRSVVDVKFCINPLHSLPRGGVHLRPVGVFSSKGVGYFFGLLVHSTETCLHRRHRPRVIEEVSVAVEAFEQPHWLGFCVRTAS